ncbi:DUF3500 domain-containing protein [Paraglaciecola hydrolytica]|uniref:DUF3500 domain-containing protein n=1 Tax=Paraglaciecola hydrolytica TaxID=1799789 RepID=A0A136A3N5_9ALTE|nr:DUF3500 domain-containing protein [Paraglaciecola hydrolytica]KXI29740.1 hypothetical protein AX660_06790 [Paraglaciecola hydrolytica]
MKVQNCLWVIMVAMLSTSGLCIAQQDKYSNDFLAVKKHFSDIEVAALAERFEGLSTSQGKQQELFPIRNTGVSTAPIVEAAKAYLSLLSTPELIRTQFAVDDPEWRRWFNVDNGIYVRQGLSLKEMNHEQRKAAWGLLESSLSAKGLDLSKNIMKTDRTLSELNGHGFLDEDLYFLTIMGTPDDKEPWGWQMDGHHLVINYFVMGDQVVMTPTFLGAEPAVTTSGKYAGNKVLQAEQDRGLALMQSLTTDQQQAATLSSRKTHDNMQAAAHQDNLVIDYSGIKASVLDEEQQHKLLDLIGSYVANMKESHAKVRMDEVRTHLENTWFAWVGDVNDDSVFYYRIHSPVILIEFDHQVPVGTEMLHENGVPTRDHIHVVIRTPNGNDYGKDLLQQHLATHKH